MLHTSNWLPKVFPYYGDITPIQIDRLQDLSATPTPNREKIKEIGRVGTVAWRGKIPTTRVTARQLEYGNLAFYRQLANVSDATTAIDLDDFKTSMVDIVGYASDDDGTFKGSVWYPKLRTAGFNISIGNTQANIERSFDLIGEDETILQGDNKYFIYKRLTAGGTGVQTITVSDPVPAEDPTSSGSYLLRVLRVDAGGDTTALTYSETTPDATSDTYNFSAPSTLTVYASAGDIYKVYFSASSYIGGTAIFTENDSDEATLKAENASIYLYVSENNYVHKLQSVSIDVAFTRADYFEIGDDEIAQTGIKDKVVRVTLGRILETYTIEEVLRGEAADYGKINIREFLDTTTLRVKLYSDAAKATFKLGFKITDLAPTSFDAGVPLDDYATRNATLESESMTISNQEATIDA